MGATVEIPWPDKAEASAFTPADAQATLQRLRAGDADAAFELIVGLSHLAFAERADDQGDAWIGLVTAVRRLARNEQQDPILFTKKTIRQAIHDGRDRFGVIAPPRSTNATRRRNGEPEYASLHRQIYSRSARWLPHQKPTRQCIEDSEVESPEVAPDGKPYRRPAARDYGQNPEKYIDESDGILRNQVEADLLALWHLGDSELEIASTLGVTRHRVRTIKETLVERHRRSA